MSNNQKRRRSESRTLIGIGVGIAASTVGALAGQVVRVQP